MALEICQLKLTEIDLLLRCTLQLRMSFSGYIKESIMIIDNVLSLKTDAELLKAIERAASKKLSAHEIQEQRVSYVYGSMGNKNSVTREHVRQIIRAQEGMTQAQPA